MNLGEHTQFKHPHHSGCYCHKESISNIDGGRGQRGLTRIRHLHACAFIVVAASWPGPAEGPSHSADKEMEAGKGSAPQRVVSQRAVTGSAWPQARLPPTSLSPPRSQTYPVGAKCSSECSELF